MIISGILVAGIRADIAFLVIFRLGDHQWSHCWAYIYMLHSIYELYAYMNVKKSVYHLWVWVCMYLCYVLCEAEEHF